ncbi:MAG: hypothetical protein F4047_08050 [Caldilineaceae bacterium SB0670_bin_27]|uniref:Lipoprotein n=1 Tax=Caldilineaceae bacterium SB0664_bin_27 TaxID=2605260 RepID=A0A6B0YQR3_9CHLR|nr:hypothetical protein [Caldilineaceae bacterium]MDE0337804.1 hypothetical protein [Caldilineaceae bacterium]MXY93454.1 hypothetical protein [Caldilineaceae bacterium SB0664_bin_27]MYJ78086.1 hypothetical protein [Caldilineaceae bacterium SB0670_bin_27]
MNKRTPLISLVVLSLLLVVLSACTAPAAPPDRDVEISHEAALSAQDALMGGIVMGEVMLSESEFSSYVTKALEANSGPNQPIDSVMVWIEPDAMHFRVTLKDGVSMMGDTLDLVGNLMVSDGHLMVDLQSAGAGGMAVGGALLAPVNAQINAVLAQNIMLPASVSVAQDSGSIMISMN